MPRPEQLDEYAEDGAPVARPASEFARYALELEARIETAISVADPSGTSDQMVRILRGEDSE